MLAGSRVLDFVPKITGVVARQIPVSVFLSFLCVFGISDAGQSPAQNFIVIKGPSNTIERPPATEVVGVANEGNGEFAAETIVVEKKILRDFAETQNIQLQPIYLLIKQFRHEKHFYFLGTKDDEVWQVDWAKGARRVTRIGDLLTPTPTQLAEFEGSVYSSSVICVIQPTKDLSNGESVVNYEKEAFALSKTNSSVYSVHRSRKGPATITQLGARSKSISQSPAN